MTPYIRIKLASAALACGKNVTFKEGSCKGGDFLGCFEGDMPWRPDINDGDCARMEAQLKIGVVWGEYSVAAREPSTLPKALVVSTRYDDYPNDQAARRYVVLEMAAYLGQSREDADRDS
jgi:hypothetical protein